MIDRYFPIGPLQCSVKLPGEIKATNVRFLVSEKAASFRQPTPHVVEFVIPRLLDHGSRGHRIDYGRSSETHCPSS